MARTIAEILAYNRAYSPELNPKLFDENGHMYPEVSSKIKEIVDAFLEYAQVDDIKLSDIRVVGSNASYNYNDNSDLDVHIVTDLSKISKPETIASLYFGEVKHAFKEAYDITIKGIEVELYVEDINASAVTNGIYSVLQDKWIKEPTPMDDPTEEEIAQAEDIEDEITQRLENATDEEKEDIIDQVYVMRKDGLASQGETSPANLAFKSLRNKGILTRAKDEIKKFVSKKLSLEGKKMRESRKYRLDEDIEEAITFKDKQELLDHLANMNLSDYKEYVYLTKDGYEFCVLWSRSKYKEKTFPVILVNYKGKIIFNEVGQDNTDDLFKRAIKAVENAGVRESRRVRESVSFGEQLYTLFSETPSYNRFFNEIAKLIRDIPYEKLVSGITVYKNDFNVDIPKDYISRFAKDMRSNGYVTKLSNTGLGVRVSTRADESKKVNEMARTQNKYWIYTKNYSFLKKDEIERARYLHDSDNTTAYGPQDLIYKLEQLKDRGIEVLNIYQTYKDESSKDVTDKFRSYIL